MWCEGDVEYAPPGSRKWTMDASKSWTVTWTLGQCTSFTYTTMGPIRLKLCVVVHSPPSCVPSSAGARNDFENESEVSLQSAVRFTPKEEHNKLFPRANSNRTRNSVDIHSRVSVLCKTMTSTPTPLWMFSPICTQAVDQGWMDQTIQKLQTCRPSEMEKKEKNERERKKERKKESRTKFYHASAVPNITLKRSAMQHRSKQ